MFSLPKRLRSLSMTASRPSDAESVLKLLEELLSAQDSKLKSFTGWSYSGCLLNFNARCMTALTHLDLVLFNQNGRCASQQDIMQSGLQTAFSNLRTFAISAPCSRLPSILELLESASLLESWTLGKCDALPDLLRFPKAVSKLRSIYLPFQYRLDLFSNPAFRPNALHMR